MEQEHVTGSYQMIQPQLRETSETVATSQEEPSQLQMTTSQLLTVLLLATLYFFSSVFH